MHVNEKRNEMGRALSRTNVVVNTMLVFMKEALF